MAVDLKFGTIVIPGVPDDMPCFVILGKDRAAVEAIEDGYYEAAAGVGADPALLGGVEDAAAAIRSWQAENPSLVKVPD